MDAFHYIARDTAGQRRDGVKQAVSASDVLSWLREQGFTPVSVDAIQQTVERVKTVHGRRKSIKSSDLAALCWQLTTMVEGGIPITSALETIADDIDNLRFQEILKEVLSSMHKGQTFSESLAGFPRVFNSLTIAMVMAGESGGALPDTLRRLAQYFDDKDKLKKKITTAMAYPVFVFIFIIGIVAFMMAFIIPKFQKIFEKFGGDLPAFTQAFMDFYSVTKVNIHYIAGAVVLSIVSATLISKTGKGHYIFSKIFLKLPLIGKLISQGFVAMFCRTMATLIGAGVSVLEVFDILAGMTNNDIIKRAIINTRERLVEGANLSLSISSSGFFPNLVIKMMQVGEESGSLSRVLDRTADYYERKVDATIKTLVSLLEPIMIVTVGSIVLVVVIALYLPIFTLK
ncbi:MAG: type II secretion system F family protein [Sedimentisphaerales bacterium]|nr:type II secretion system F family protein [Sedimentisphaerales bacterium]